jgi:hypothetical protein
MTRHQIILRQVTAEWEAKARIHREAARYWEFTRLGAIDNDDKDEVARATERFDAEMAQLSFAIGKLRECSQLRL